MAVKRKAKPNTKAAKALDRLHEGVIRERPDGRWEWRITMLSGRRRSIYAKTRPDLVAAVNRDQDKDGPLNQDRERTLGTLLKNWMEQGESRRRPPTNREYRSYLKNIEKASEQVATLLQEVKPGTIRGIYKVLDGTIGPSYMPKVHVFLKAAIRYAVAEGWLDRDPFPAITAPTHIAEPRDYWKLDEVTALFIGVEGDPYEAFWILALRAGMRRGEMLGLKWEYVDLDAAVLYVRGQTTRDGYMTYLKTSRSRRTIHLDRTTVEVLRRRKRQAVPDSEFVLTTLAGERYDPFNFYKNVFLPTLRRLKMRRITIHDMRGTLTSIAADHKISLSALRDRLGHEQIGTTGNHYVRTGDAAAAEAAGALGDILDQAMMEAKRSEKQIDPGSRIWQSRRSQKRNPPET